MATNLKAKGRLSRDGPSIVLLLRPAQTSRTPTAEAMLTSVAAVGVGQ